MYAVLAFFGVLVVEPIYLLPSICYFPNECDVNVNVIWSFCGDTSQPRQINHNKPGGEEEGVHGRFCTTEGYYTEIITEKYHVFSENCSLSYLWTLGWIDSVLQKSVHWRNRFHETRCACIVYTSPYINSLPKISV